MNTFNELNLKPAIMAALSRDNIAQPTPIQAQAIPVAMEGKDVLAQAKTGSGKTLAFAVPGLQQIDITNLSPQIIVLCPTRELAEQVAEQYRRAGSQIGNLKVLTLCGGFPMGPQIASLKHGSLVFVGTPGRMADHFDKQRLDFRSVRMRVLDEADRMLDMGFTDDLNKLFGAMPTPVQTLFFSATFTKAVEKAAQQYLSGPVSCKVEDAEVAHNDIEQLVYTVQPDQRLQALKAVLTHYQPATAIVFCNTKIQVQEVVTDLQNEGFSAGALQGDMEQLARTDMLMRFSSDCLSVLVATDVAARGLDIASVDCVINYVVSEEPEAHVHRIGRTGRGGQKGQAFTLCSDKEQLFLSRIETLCDLTFEQKGAQSLRFHRNRIIAPVFVCITLNGGKKQKLRPGDILGALTKDAGIAGEDIGKISVQNSCSYVAVKLRGVKRALALFREGKIKGKRLRARKLV